MALLLCLLPAAVVVCRQAGVSGTCLIASGASQVCAEAAVMFTEAERTYAKLTLAGDRSAHASPVAEANGQDAQSKTHGE